jgi:gamma-glutamylcyclotransferase
MAIPIFGKAHESTAGADFTWFVYGSSLDGEAFAAWAREHGYAPPDLSRGRPARLPGFRLAFDVVSRHWGGAVGSLAEAPGEAVHGLALALPGATRGLVDHKEGALSGLFEPLPVTLELADGARVAATAYRAAPGRRLAADAEPSREWLAVVARGARAAGLAPEWIARLDRLAGGGAGRGS